MKRFMAFVLMLLLVMLCFSACSSDKGTEDFSNNTASDTTTETSSVTDEVGSSDISSITESSVIPSQDAGSSENVSSLDSSSVVSKPARDSVKVGAYTVFDPDNKRGLSTKKYGFSFGAAKDGKPHSISVNNQANFDKMENVEALALDTVSTDKGLYLTFDNGYEYENLTLDILDILKEKNVKAAFFITLSYAKNNHQIVQRMIQDGHIVGNHSATHPVFPEISREKMADELYRVDQYLQENFDYKTQYFRFPTGAYSENSLELCTSVGYKNIFWSVAHYDYETDDQPTKQEAFDVVTGRMHPGAVILLHAISKANTDALGDIIDYALEEGYTFKTLDDYFK